MTTLRAWWWHRQGLDGSLQGVAPAEALERTGWARSVGGSNPYLTLFARTGTSRAEADRAVSALDIYELPAARACTYVVPSVHFGLALQVGRHAPEADLKVLDRLGVARQEIDHLCADVLAVLDGADALDPAQLKDSLGGSVRSLGEEGRKRGQSTTLPAALGLLQAVGEIRRVPANGRLDQQRYAYTRWSAPSTGLDDAAARAEMARLYFDWIAPASVAHFRWFSAFSAAQTKAALAPLDLVDVGEGLVAPATLAKEFAAYVPPAKPRYSLIASIDALVLLRRDHHALLDEAGLAAMVAGDKTSLGGVADLPDHAIVDRGRIVGLWQYDYDAGTVVAWVFGGKADRSLTEAIERTVAYVRDQLGDARSFSLDSPRSRAPRIAALAASRPA